MISAYFGAQPSGLTYCPMRMSLRTRSGHWRATWMATMAPSLTVILVVGVEPAGVDAVPAV
jgi:hypothetical protein